MKKVLLITDVNFWEKSSGHRMRIYSLIEYLATQVELTVVNTGPAPQKIELFLKETFNANFFVLEKTKYLSSNGYGRKLKTLIKDKQFDSIIIEYIHCSYFLNFLEDGPTLFLDTHDIISERTAEFKKYNYPVSPYEMAEADEIEILNVYDYIIAISEPDYYTLSQMISEDKVLLCPHSPSFSPCLISADVENISFVASSYLPNIDAINWFIENCWEELSTENAIKLNIYGSVGNCLSAISDSRILIKGFVADAEQIYKNSDIIINPVRFGAGLKIKNIEALAHGLPLVTTTHGARGIEAGIGNTFLIADEAPKFINQIKSLIQSKVKRDELAHNAASFINVNFSVARCFEKLSGALNIYERGNLL